MLRSTTHKINRSDDRQGDIRRGDTTTSDPSLGHSVLVEPVTDGHEQGADDVSINSSIHQDGGGGGPSKMARADSMRRDVPRIVEQCVWS